MKKLIFKCVLIAAFVYAIVISVNIIADPANIAGDDMVNEMAGRLLAGEIVASPGDYNEGLLQKIMLDAGDPDTVIIGSSSVLYIPWEYDNYQVIGLSGAYLWDDLAAVGLLDAEGDLPERVVICVDPWILRTDQGVGHHDSIAEYGRFEAALSSGVPYEEAAMILDEKKTDDSWKEFLSFSYFQSSVEYIGKWGWGYALSPAEEKIRSISEADSESIPCILPDGRHTCLGQDSVAKMDGDVNWYIESGHIDSFGEEFASLSEDNAGFFEDLIRHLTEEGVTVELYLPAMYPVLYDHIASSELYEGVELSEIRIREMASRYGITVHGTFNPHLSGIEKEDFADWHHIKPEKGIEEYHFILEQS
ncbi:MAG: hypothetical protein IKI46_06735 [Lachnospiraceae bacterium]|nr:hypothetical protein [Lachnospiraceae bacterium]